MTIDQANRAISYAEGEQFIEALMLKLGRTAKLTNALAYLRRREVSGAPIPTQLELGHTDE